MTEPNRDYNIGTSKEYKLNHWGLIRILDAVAASGNLHCRLGYPDGAEVQTSFIHSWDLYQDSVILYTTNSVYRCPLKEHVISGNSLSLLGAVRSRSGVDIEDLEEAVWNTMENEAVRYRSIMTSDLLEKGGMSPADSCVMFCWEGCDLPYLKRVVVYEKGSITIDDLPYIKQGYMNSIALSQNTSMKVRLANSSSPRCCYPYENGFSRAFVENTGNREIHVNISDLKSIPVPAGEIVRVV